MQSNTEVRVSVRNLVEFVLRHGDIDNRRGISPDNAMLEGGRIHRKIQRSMGPEYQAEVSLRHVVQTEPYALVVEGRADGIITRGDRVTVDEIKGTYRELEYLKQPVSVHLAQAKCYAYIYALQQELEEIDVRMTYCHMETEEVKYFHREFTFGELKEWFTELVQSYLKWADYSWKWHRQRQVSIEELVFPFEYREGQKELVENVYRTIYHERKLFLEAPTGVGKTISTVFPAIKAMGKGMGERIFYLTAKTITRTVAEDTFALLRERGLKFKSVIITAKDKICFMEETECNPEHCPYAKGHYDRINEAMYDMLLHEESFTREKVEEYARKHMVCPFEYCLDMSLFADGIIGDYNYLFDPHVYLKRFFAEGGKRDSLFLIDEAHNLLERGREMYSAVLRKEQFLELRRDIKMTLASTEGKKTRKNKVWGQMTLNMTELSLDKIQGKDDINNDSYENDEALSGGGGKGRSIFQRRGYGDKLIHLLDKCNKVMLSMKRECEHYVLLEEIDELVRPLMRLNAVTEEYLGEQEEPFYQKQLKEMRSHLLDFYFVVSHFLQMYERTDSHYVKYSALEDDGGFMVKLFCVDPSANLRECMERGRSSILFSATFLPIQYYKSLLGGDEKDYEVYAESVFDPSKRGLFIADDVTTKYTRRSEEEYRNIARYIYETVQQKKGNYMVFCPSYQMLHRIYEIYGDLYAGDTECIIQQEYMKEGEREAFLDRFRGNAGLDLAELIRAPIEVEESASLVGFCVLGGIFSEGIDLKKESLIGAIIVGTGLPLVCPEREIIRFYFEDRYDEGFDYAYRFPGMNKVLQAAGRVIRTEEDEGVVLLLDERFLQASYRKLFPREWTDYHRVSLSAVGKGVADFWHRIEDLKE